MLQNVYEDQLRADSYATLEFPGTYYLAYRDIPEIVKKHAKGNKALDFGCGAGRSTRFLCKIGFNALGVDISGDMIKKAKEIDPEGKYQQIENGHFGSLQHNTFDLVLSMFTFDNIGTYDEKLINFKRLKELLNKNGRIVNLVSSPEIYKNEWASFSTKDFPENQTAQCGDVVKIIMTDVVDKRPVLDVIWPHENYMKIYEKAGLEVEAVYKPKGRFYEPVSWVNELDIAPWVIYVLKKRSTGIDKWNSLLKWRYYYKL